MFMIFTRCIPNKGCDLYYSIKDKSGFWMKPVRFPSPVNTRYWESQPSFAPDSKTLYFTSNRPGGKGGMDIWKTKYLGNGAWAKPVNLGDSINTKGNEMSPFIHFDNKTLYFSSDYFPGMGGFDLFYSKKISDTSWTSPKNLGYPINTTGDEYRLVVDATGERAYFSSQKDTITKQDIYYFDFPEKLRPTRTIYVRAKIFNNVDYQPLKADLVSIINLSTNDTMYFGKKTDKFVACLPCGGEYALNILKKGWMMESQNFKIDDMNDTVKYYDIEVFLNPILVSEKINLKNTFFNTDSYNIDQKSYVELDKVVDFLNINSNVEIQIAGHTDNVGTYEYNMQLSEKRALAIKNYLIEKGINENRISYVGYGYTKPIANNQTEKGRKLNRRTEIIILKK